VQTTKMYCTYTLVWGRSGTRVGHTPETQDRATPPLRRPGPRHVVIALPHLTVLVSSWQRRQPMQGVVVRPASWPAELPLRPGRVVHLTSSARRL
jgi:hypothetical protein